MIHTSARMATPAGGASGLRPVRILVAVGCAAVMGAGAWAQSSGPSGFETLSITRTDPRVNSGGLGTQPDGTQVMKGSTIAVAVKLAVPASVRDVVGLPDWARRERYDIIARPPAGTTPEQRQEMWRALFAERMKLEGHVEAQERDTYSLVVAPASERFGSELAPSTLDCDDRRGPVTLAGAPIEGVGPLGGWIQADCMRMDRLTVYLAGLAGRLVDNHTGLDGFYAVSLKWSKPPRGAAPPPDGQPDLLAALEQQLGLQLLPQKSHVPVFVVDHIERPSLD
jgi:bla regulator protein BlaR1